MARVTVGGRLHMGFCNLSLSRPRLYGGIGVALAEPALTVEATPADGVDAADPVAAYAERAVDRLSVRGAKVRVVEALPRHVGLGSGTRIALATLRAVAAAHDAPVDVRAAAPALGRGGRSGVGVATFEDGGFVVDAGHPTELFTTGRPPDGEWTVPPVAARHPIPEDWRFVLVRPDAAPGRDGPEEEATIREVVERADADRADEIARVVIQRLLPAAAAGDRDGFGTAAARVNRLNGAWYADEQGGLYRPPVGAVVERLSAAPAVAGAGQSSWGPTVWGLTDTRQADTALAAGEAALEAADVDGEVTVVAARNTGASVER